MGSERIGMLRRRLEQVDPVHLTGKVSKVVGLLVEGWLPDARVGAMCRIEPPDGQEPVAAEVVGFRREAALLMPLGPMQGVAPGSSISSQGLEARVGVGPGLQGRVVDGLGRPLDGMPPAPALEQRSIYNPAPNPLGRRPPRRPLSLGIKVIDTCLTCAEGQRMGIVAGTGLGKSVLCGIIGRHSQADVNVIALIGERGREVRQFLDRDLGQEGLARSVVVAVTGDRSPVERTRAAFLATTIAEYFRDQGRSVLLIMDSLTRVAMAQREVGLAVGEPPTSKGYPPSVLALLPRLVERAGTAAGRGSITALYTVLAEQDDMEDPVVDAARAVLDGHIVLSRQLASRGHWPAIDILASVSRLMNDVVDDEHRRLAAQVRSLIADYEEAKDLVHVGAYQRGSNPRIDRALEVIEELMAFTRQSDKEFYSLEESLQQLRTLLQSGRGGR
ncbi:MAG: EscN/YscN/HrcN family type III secretion system ATPase [Deltaproteobacteria bacterium]|nr:MAG: EscN/YscN/HrcN family type III secretion system ATPase [Deltaproteobacteria bacterium]